MELLNEDLKKRIKECMDRYEIQLTTDTDIEMYLLEPLITEFTSQCVAYANEFNKTKPVNWNAVDQIKDWKKINIK